MLLCASMSDRGRQLKKFPCQRFFNIFWTKSNWLPSIFLLTSILSCTKTQNSEAPNHLYCIKVAKIKNPHGFVIWILKVSGTDLQGFFYLCNFYTIKLILEPLTWDRGAAPNWGQIEKCLIDQLLLGKNLLKMSLTGNFFELMTLNVQGYCAAQD